MGRRLAAAAALVVAASVLVTGSVAADSHPGQTAIGLTLRGNIVDTELTLTVRSETYMRELKQVEVYEYNGKRYAMTWADQEGLYQVEITDVDSIVSLPELVTDSRSGTTRSRGASTSWVANDGNRYYLAAWESSDALQSFATHSDGRIWARWANGQRKFIQDGSRIGDPKDVLVYQLQDGVCQTAAGCEVFTGVKVNQGEAIYKHYAVVATSGGLFIYDVTDPNDMCTCSSGSGLTALLRGSILDSSSLYLDGTHDIEYYQQAGKHYVLASAEREDAVTVIDISDPTNPVARGFLRDTTALVLDNARHSSVYTANGRVYAAVVSPTDNGLQIVDITDPTSITAAGNLTDTSALVLYGTTSVAVHTIGSRHYAVTASTTEDGIQIIEVTDPDNPVAKSNMRHSSGRLLDGAIDVDTFDENGRHYAIVATEVSNALQIIELTEVFAEAGNDVSVPKTATQVTLDGTGSTVSSGVTPTYAWTQTAGATATLSNASTARPSFVPPSAGGELTFRLTVTAAGVSASDTVVVTVEASSNSVDSFGAKISGNAISTEEIDKPDGGTATYISMHFSGENETKSIAYSLLAQPTGTATVNVMSLVQSAGYGASGYTWDWDAVSVSPSTLTFTAQNWNEPQVINITSNVDGDHTPEQVLIVFQTYALGKYTGIHVTVDDPASGVSGTSVGDLTILQPPQDLTPQEQTPEPHNGAPAGDGNVGVAEPNPSTDSGTDSGAHGGARPPTTHQQPDTTGTIGDTGTGDTGGDTEPTDTDPNADDADAEVTLDQVQTALEQYANGDITAEELRDLIRRYLAS